eukprot:3665214-Rhodomonas_salina.1
MAPSAATAASDWGTQQSATVESSIFRWDLSDPTTCCSHLWRNLWLATDHCPKFRASMVGNRVSSLNSQMESFSLRTSTHQFSLCCARSGCQRPTSLV